VLRELGGWATLAMVERYAHLGVSHLADWAGNVGGTNPVQVPGRTAKQLRRQGSRTEESSMGWLRLEWRS
jgi:hypothetical protein